MEEKEWKVYEKLCHVGILADGEIISTVKDDMVRFIEKILT
jgi:hypothetical protein